MIALSAKSRGVSQRAIKFCVRGDNARSFACIRTFMRLKALEQIVQLPAPNKREMLDRNCPRQPQRVRLDRNVVSSGELKQIDDANVHTAKYDYNDAGRLIKITGQLGKGTILSYNGYDLSEATDPLWRTTKRITDTTGLLMSSTDSSSNRTMLEYDLLDQPTAVVDPMNYRTAAAYDGNGNIEKVTDANTNIHKFSFDGRNAVDSETNPLVKAETYIYDEAHNLKQKTDRKKQITKYTYDDLNRLATVTFADNSVVTYIGDQAYHVVERQLIRRILILHGYAPLIPLGSK